MRLKTVLLIAKLIERDGDICQLCNHTLKKGDINLDHIVPLSHGGTDSIVTQYDNLRVTHSICNLMRGNNDCPDCNASGIHCNPKEKRRQILAQKISKSKAMSVAKEAKEISKKFLETVDKNTFN
jgi:hypothetical protein